MALDPRDDGCDTHLIIRTLLKTAYKKAEIPKRWQVAQTAQLDKDNGKIGCKAARLINITCPLGKVFSKFCSDRSNDVSIISRMDILRIDVGNRLS